ncbi:MAG: hypothetical protein L6R35_003144, partial [Caloplaca aegaea]
IEILPSSLCPTTTTTILHAGSSIGIPKHILLALFPHARAIFLDARKEEDGDGQDEAAALDATAVLLLLNPEHLSAANFRKRCLRRRQHDEDEDEDEDAMDIIITREMLYIETLVTSPLYRHAKSPTLWAHRLWVLKTFHRLIVLPCNDDDGDDGNEKKGDPAAEVFMTRELGMVMKAGERHAGNYHAWNYAREMLRFLTSRAAVERMMAAWVERTHAWCLAHPRDISGWSFLVFLLRHHQATPDDSHAARARHVYCKTRAFVERVGGWRGKSVDWFLASEARIRDPR